MIEVEGLHKRFGEVKALDGVDFSVKDGEVIGLLGPNGAGKTTALRILYTVMRPDKGAARVDGFDVLTHRKEVQRRIGVLPDSRGLYPRLTAREHVRYYGKLHGLRGKELNRRVDELVEILNMAEFANRRAKGFSRGQTRKVALARALVHSPRNLMLDEPTNGLDVASSKAVHEMIKGFRDEGRCIVLCSHIMQEVATVCDRLVVISHGRVAAEGAPDKLLERTGRDTLEDMFLSVTGGKEGL